ncbi:ubiquinone biosynthesis protein UbiA [Desulfonema ishimotonii]|uniref:Ubiquinone biosynthesis protein UbiA n=1 Tax=Desulfonema ishimotonii TaxID=45657 RepID=A0A401FRZ4_9BACT|nr:UbiA family prenyltransferase [Desulfonema ishimotonii]GBC59742.1 ubiquinone biosynthesis protein UbiA [Desulfonema ishimotonii]
MKLTSDAIRLTGFSRLKFFWALSRTPHALLDMTTPAFAACLWLGSFPPISVILLGLLTVFAGYTAVYALNDVVDFRVDRERIQQDTFQAKVCTADDLDAALTRHPMACGCLSFKQGLTWAISWGAVAFLGAYLLNPVCAAIFMAGCVLEAVYCRLFRVSPFRAFINGIVKTLGALAAVFAVDPNPSWVYLATLFMTIFMWELGGQNIPNDCSDIEEDQRLKAQTIPVRFGAETAGFAVVATLTGAVLLTPVLFSLSQARFGAFYYMTIAVAGVWLLLMPAFRFYRTKAFDHAMALFNRASYYPALLFTVVILRLLS